MNVRVKAAGRILRFYRELITECIPLFVASGLIAALCGAASLAGISCPDEISRSLYQVVIPVMVGYKAGRKCGGDAGGLAGALAASAVLMPGTVSAFVASILAGVCSGYIYRKGMERLEGVIPSGFEMLTSNLYLAASGIAGGMLAFYMVLPCVAGTERALAAGIAMLADFGLLPWSAVLVEPLKILFFNNWLNHGFLLPLGLEQVRSAGGSILFLLETNPGPGFGILTACALTARKERKDMASNLVIQMFGGIHEIYFPYVLADLRLVTAAVAGGVAGNYSFMLTGCRLRGPASPGSVITILMMSQPGQWLGLIAGILVSAVVSFGVACLFLRHAVAEKGDVVRPEEPVKRKRADTIKIYFVCDAGMGSSAMACALFKKKLKAAGVGSMEVFHVSADRIPGDADVLVCQQSFAASLPATSCPCFTVENLTDMSGYEALFRWLKGDE